jgi:hypothetical protein
MIEGWGLRLRLLLYKVHSPPHEYTIRNWRPEADDDFLKAASGIREFGYEQNFYESTYVYFDLDALKYWTMGAPLRETVVLNRTSVENRYDASAARGAAEHEDID